jgi:hypothetical protein
MTNVNEKFMTVYNGAPNFMTPDIEYRKIVGDYGIELSSGEILRRPSKWLGQPPSLFGVTVLSNIHSDAPIKEHGLNGSFNCKDAAEEHIATICGGQNV